MSFFLSQEFLNHLLSQSDLVDSFRKSPSSLERMKVVIHYLDTEPGFQQSLKEFSDSPVKDRHQSLAAKKTGVNEFAAKRLFPALLKTNESLSLAPPGCDFLPQLFGNRSAILFDLGKYEECLVNISLALAHPLPELLRAKLLFRKSKCLRILNEPHAVKSYNESMEVMKFLLAGQEKVSTIELKQISALKRKFEESWKDLANNNCSKAQTLLKTDKNSISSAQNGEHDFSLRLSTRNERFPVACSQISILKNDQFGRGVFATGDIAPGQVVVFEEATVALLCPQDTFRLNHCHHCLKRNMAVLIPCEGCDVLFCNETCKKESYNSIHRSECQILSRIKRIPLFGIVEMLALRFVLREAAQEEHIDAKWQKISEVASQEEDYSSLVYQLETNEASRDTSDMMGRTFKAAILCHLFNTQKFFSVETTNQLDSKILKFGCLLMHYFQVVACNAHDINAFFTGPQCPSGDQVQIGSGLYPFCSMFNHSCDPNVVRHSQNGSRVIVTALKAIRKGDQLFDNYGCHFATMRKAQRQSYLWKQYRFQCSCQACEKDFALFKPDLEEEPIKFVTNITGAIREEIQCSVERFNDLLNQIINAGQSPLKDVLGTLSMVNQHMDLLNRYVEQPHRQFEKCQETYKRLLCYLTNYFVLEEGETIPD